MTVLTSPGAGASRAGTITCLSPRMVEGLARPGEQSVCVPDLPAGGTHRGATPQGESSQASPQPPETK